MAAGMTTPASVLLCTALLLGAPARPARAQAAAPADPGASPGADATAAPEAAAPPVSPFASRAPARATPTGLGTSINPAFGVGLPTTPGVVPGTLPGTGTPARGAVGQGGTAPSGGPDDRALGVNAPGAFATPDALRDGAGPGGFASQGLLGAPPGGTIGGGPPNPNLGGLNLPVSLGSSFLLPTTGVLPLSGAVPGDTALGGGYTGNVRAQIEGALGLEPDRVPGVLIVPSLGVQELLTDNVNSSAHGRVADVVTTISPSILASVDTQRVQGSLAYSPNVQLYAVTGRQNQIDHELNAQATAVLVPDLLFVDLRGFATQQSTTGGYGQSAQPFYSQGQRAETSSFLFSPYVVHRLGDLLQVRAGYSLSYVDQSGDPAFGLANTGLDPATLAALSGAQNPSFRGTSTLSNREYVTLSTTPELGRLASTLQLRAEQDSGNGVLDGAHRNEAVEDVAYALNRFVALLGRVGYQDILYGGLPVTRIEQGVYGVGLRLTPSPASGLVVRYGHHDGFDSAFLNASYAVTARTRVFAGYSEGLTTDQEQISDTLADSTVDAAGVSLDSNTAAPLVLGDNLLGYQNSLYRLRRFSATAVTSYDLDSLSASVLYEKRTLVASGIGFAGYSDSGVSGVLSWSHVLDESTTSVLSGQYGTHRYDGSTTGLPTIGTGEQNTFSLTAGLSHRLSPTLTGTLQYTLTNQAGSGTSQGYLQNIVLVGLRKSF